eukprot:SAG11_NODE_8278_length_1035_cov_1.742521_2_plen_92_part_00
MLVTALNFSAAPFGLLPGRVRHQNQQKYLVAYGALAVNRKIRLERDRNLGFGALAGLSRRTPKPTSSRAWRHDTLHTMTRVTRRAQRLRNA